MKLRARFGTREDVRHQSADNRTNDPEPDRPHKRHVHVHDRFRHEPGDQTNDDVPNQMKHVSSLSDSTPTAEMHIMWTFQKATQKIAHFCPPFSGFSTLAFLLCIRSLPAHSPLNTPP